MYCQNNLGDKKCCSVLRGKILLKLFRNNRKLVQFPEQREIVQKISRKLVQFPEQMEIVQKQQKACPVPRIDGNRLEIVESLSSSQNRWKSFRNRRKIVQFPEWMEIVQKQQKACPVPRIEGNCLEIIESLSGSQNRGKSFRKLVESLSSSQNRWKSFRSSRKLVQFPEQMEIVQKQQKACPVPRIDGNCLEIVESLSSSQSRGVPFYWDFYTVKIEGKKSAPGQLFGFEGIPVYQGYWF